MYVEDWLDARRLDSSIRAIERRSPIYLVCAKVKVACWAKLHCCLSKGAQPRLESISISVIYVHAIGVHLE
jgi:hypothetical protein